MQYQGTIGYAGSVITFETPQSIGVTMPANTYPEGTLTFDNIADGNAYWKNNSSSYARSINLYLCDSEGNNRVFLFTVSLNKGGSNTTIKTANVSGAQALAGKALYLVADGDNTIVQLRRQTTITVNAVEGTHTISGLGATGGSFSLSKTEAVAGETITVTCSPDSGWSASAPSSSPAVTMTSAGANKWTFTMPNSDITITPNFSKINYTVSGSVSPSGSGSISLSKTTANIGDTITITATPGTGWRLVSLATNPSRTITNNKFTMPAGNVAVTATFEKISYSITKAASPSAGGTVTTNKNSANYGDTVTVSQTPAAGYYFNGWTKTPSNLAINNGQFTMPAQNVSLTANYLKRSTASLASTSLTSGGTVKLTISPDKSTYSHKYKLSFGTNMETGWVNVAAGTTQVNISIPDSWANYIPSATQKTGGTLVLETYNGSTKIGEYTISGLTYNVRANAVPTLSDITKSIARTIGGVTYANVGDYYVQNKCGVSIAATAAGVLGSSITSIACTLSGYSGSSYNKTVTNTTSLSYTTGLLSVTGTITITVVATDSRGRTATKTTTITVTPYNKPSGTLAVRRVDASGNDDTLGTYAKYTKTSSYTAVGSNSLSVKMRVGTGTAVTISDNAGDILPGNRQTFSQISEYNIELILQDAFETVNIIAKLPTAQFLISLGADGTRMAFMKAVNESLSKNGKNGVLELSDLVQIYIGSETLEAYIRRIANS